MKMFFAITGIAFLSVMGAIAQAVNASHEIGRVDGDHEDSEEYVARTPYTLRWRADATYKLYGKSDPTVKTENYLAGIHVYDVATGEMVCSVGKSPLAGEVRVPVAGRHIIKVFCTGALELSFEEDKAALEAAAKRGELKDGVTIETARAGSLRTKNEKIDVMKAKLLKLLEGQRSSIGDNAVEALRLDVERTAQLASSEQDFTARFQALSGATVERIKAERNATGTTAVPAAAPTWSGKGLPPGMHRR